MSSEFNHYYANRSTSPDHQGNFLAPAHALWAELKTALLAFHKKYLQKQLEEGVTWYSGIMGLRKEGGDSDRRERAKVGRNARENAKKWSHKNMAQYWTHMGQN
jgi:hypothetical protein